MLVSMQGMPSFRLREHDKHYHYRLGMTLIGAISAVLDRPSPPISH